MSAALVAVHRARVWLDYHGPGMRLEGEVDVTVLGPVRTRTIRCKRFDGSTPRGYSPRAQSLVLCLVDGESKPRDIELSRFVHNAPEPTPAMVPVEAPAPTVVEKRVSVRGTSSPGGEMMFKAGEQQGVFEVIGDTGRRLAHSRAVYQVRCTKCGAVSEKSSGSLARARRLGSKRCKRCPVSQLAIWEA